MNQTAFKIPPPPPARSVKGDEWIPAFGRFWSPKDWRTIQHLGIAQLDDTPKLDKKLEGFQVDEILFSYRTTVRDTVALALFIGWSAGLLAGVFVL